MCEGWSPEIAMAIRGSGFAETVAVRRQDRVDSALGEFPEREIAMPRVEELVEASMLLVQHDWELYRAGKAKR